MGRPPPESSLLAAPSSHTPKREIISCQDISLYWQRDLGSAQERLILAFISGFRKASKTWASACTAQKGVFEEFPPTEYLRLPQTQPTRPLGWAVCHLFPSEPLPKVQMMTLGSSRPVQFNACCSTVALRFLSYISQHIYSDTPVSVQVSAALPGSAKDSKYISEGERSGMASNFNQGHIGECRCAAQGYYTQHLSCELYSSCVQHFCSATERNGKG